MTRLYVRLADGSKRPTQEEALTKANGPAFGVAFARRRHGAERALHESAIRRARDLGWYELRSHRGGHLPKDHWNGQETSSPTRRPVPALPYGYGSLGTSFQNSGCLMLG